jgi:hypothetical protein
VLVLAALPATGRAQGADPLVKAKALYADAAYEEALNVLGPGEGAEAQQYRALCFIALGRNQEAERAIETLIRTSPTFKVQDAELPPRLVNMFAQTRQRVIPDVVRRLFADARNDFQAKELQRARPKFEQVLTLLRDPSMSGAADAKDLELLTTGYLDIVKNTPPPAPVPAKTTAAPVASATAAPAAVAPRTAPVKPVVVTPAVTIRQTVPAFTVTQPPRPHPSSGAVRVVIGVDGKVKSATMDRPIEPRYDARVLAATKTWEYEPAMRGGQPVESEKIVEIQLESR